MEPNKTILLVEDNPDDELLTKRALNKNNIKNEIIVVRDGAEALDYLFAQGSYSHRKVEDLPTVVLLDIKLPKIDGIEVLHRLRTDPRTRLLPIVILTTSNEETDILRSYNLGANSFVRKPVDFNEFMRSVGQLGLYWLLINQSPPIGSNPARAMS